jgi:hypothetical protein
VVLIGVTGIVQPVSLRSRCKNPKHARHQGQRQAPMRRNGTLSGGHGNSYTALQTQG